MSIATDHLSPTFCGRLRPRSSDNRRNAEVCLGFWSAQPPAPNTYRGSAAAGCGGATAIGRCVLETFLCPHAVPCKGVISSVKREPRSRGSVIFGLGGGADGVGPLLFLVLVDGERAGVQSTRPAVGHVAMDPCRHRSDISFRELGLQVGSAFLTRVMRSAHGDQSAVRQERLVTRIRGWIPAVGERICWEHTGCWRHGGEFFRLRILGRRRRACWSGGKVGVGGWGQLSTASTGHQAGSPAALPPPLRPPASTDSILAKTR